MSEKSNEFGKLQHKPRSKKLNSRVDLTAMVSVSFLLIAFYMVSAELCKPKTIELGLPEGSCGPGYGCCWNPDQRRIITLLLDKKNTVISYNGLLDMPIEKPKRLTYGRNGIRKELIEKNKKIKRYLTDLGMSDRGAIVIIKPSKKSNYGNLVDILDEMNIANIGTYAIVNDFSPEEAKLLASD